MIYVKLQGHDFKYQISDILKAFFYNEEIIISKAEPPEDYRGIFIYSQLDETKSQLILKTKFVFEGIIQQELESVLNLDNYKYEREKTKSIKMELKRHLYNLCNKFTGKDLPWGILTGIRPAKIVHAQLEEGLSQEDILKELNEYYLVSHKKAALLLSVANSERKIIEKTTPKMISIYIGIPFCKSTCLYCSFTSYPINKYRNLVKEYLNALRAEIELTNKNIIRSGYKIQSIYIGGGTPTSINSEEIETLLRIVQDNFDLENIEEFTLEAGRPDTIDEDKLLRIKNSKVNRISINPQTMNNETLKAIGRQHSVKEIVEKFQMARRLGFDNINMDVIAGLPNETIEMFNNTLNQIQKLNPESLTVHTMSIKRGARLWEELQNFELTNENEITKMIDSANDFANKLNMIPYYLYRQKNILGNLENIGYCKSGFESTYNVQIMEEKQSIIAFGAGATTKVVYPEDDRIERAFNVKDVEEYIKRVEEMVERKRILLEK